MNWNQELGKALIDLCKYIITMGITGLVAWFFSKKYLQQVIFAKKVNDLGLKQIVYEKYIPEKSLRRMIATGKEIKFLFFFFFYFYRDYQTILIKAANAGTKISILMLDAKHEFYQDILRMEITHGLRDSEGRDRHHKTTIIEEIDEIAKIFYGIPNVEIRKYSSGYRLPCVITEYADGNVETWFSITLPPKRTTSPSAFFLCGKTNKKDNKTDSSTGTFPEEVVNHFDSLWEDSITH